MGHLLDGKSTPTFVDAFAPASVTLGALMGVMVDTEVARVRPLVLTGFVQRID
jgi:hypothetical protein